MFTLRSRPVKKLQPYKMHCYGLYFSTDVRITTWCYTAVVILDLLEKLYTSIILLLFFSCCSPVYRSLLLLLSLFLFFYSVGNIISFPLSPFPCQPHSFLSRLQCSSAIANGHWLYKSSSICCGVFILSVFHVIQGPTALAQSSYGAFVITLYNGD